MLDAAALLTFAATTVVLLLVPGPAVVYVVTRTLQLGLARGLLGTLGVECGTLLHVAAAAVGLSSVVARSDVAYTALKYAGAAYLLFLGLRQLFGRPAGPHGGSAAEPPARSAFWQGLLVEALNPKTALFFIAFLPQFVDADGASVGLQIAFLGGLFVAAAFVIDCGYALLAARIRRRMAARTNERRLDRLSGVVHIGLAALAATARGAA